MSTDQKPEPSSSEKSAATPRQRRLRWKSGLILLVLIVVAHVVTWSAAPDRTHQVTWSAMLAPLTLLSGLIWWTFFSGLRWIGVALGYAAVVGGVVTFFQFYRFDEFDGAMMPMVVPRSHPRASVAAARYWKTQSESRSIDGDLQIETGDWAQFRGPSRDGIVRDIAADFEWPGGTPKEIWRHPVGEGFSSFAVVGSWAFTQEQRKDDECVVCYDADSGDQVWVHRDAARYATAMGGVGPRGTPTVYDGRLYALGATGILNCLDPKTGERLWHANILQDAGASNIDWGMAGSPLVYDDKVVVNPGGSQGRAVAAYDRIDGRPLWSAGGHVASYAAPRLETIRGERQLLIFDGDGIAGVQPDDGRELWRYPWTNTYKINVAQPIVVNDRVFISSGYGSGCILLDPSRLESGRPQVVWPRSSRMKLKFNDGVCRDGFVYGLDEGILACVDLRTGQQQWKRGRFGYGQILLLGQTLLALSETGELHVVRATPNEYDRVARHQLIEGKTWNHMAWSRGRLYVRNHREMACYQVLASDDPPAD